MTLQEYYQKLRDEGNYVGAFYVQKCMEIIDEIRESEV